MDGEQAGKSAELGCKVCRLQFTSYEEHVAHKRKHEEQLVYGGSVRPAVPSHLYNNSGNHTGALESFHELAQPFRTQGSGNSVMPSRQDPRNNIQVDRRPLLHSSQSDNRNLNQSQSPVDPRNVVPSSPVDIRNTVPSSPGDMRNMVPSSPADVRNMVPSSPAENRNFAASSPADIRNMVPHSPAGDQRKLVASSPIDQRNMMVSSPPDPRMFTAGSHPDLRNLSSSVNDNRNVGHLNMAEQRSVMSASPVDQRNLIANSPAEQRVLNSGHIEQRGIGSPAVVPSSVERQQPVVSASQLEARDIDQRRIQSLVAEIRTLDSRSSADMRAFAPPNSNMYRRDENPGFTAVTRSVNNQGPNVSTLPSMSMDSRVMPQDAHTLFTTNSQSVPYNSVPIPYNSSSYLDSLNHDFPSVYTSDMSGRSVASYPYSGQVSIPVDGQGQGISGKVDGPVYTKHEPNYGLTKSDFTQSKDKAVDGHMAGPYPGMKMLASQSSTYQPAFPTHAPPKYDVSKAPVMPGNYYNQTGVQDPTAKVEHMLHNPKQTLHYGQPHQSRPQQNHSQFQDSIPKQEQHGHQQQQPTPQQHPQIASPIPVHPGMDQLRGYPPSMGVPSNPNYNQLNKGPVPQIHAPVPSRALPSQHGYNMSSEAVRKHTTEAEQNSQLTCYLCQARFSTMNELSEHTKLHAQGMVSQDSLNVHQKHVIVPQTSSQIANSSFKPTNAANKTYQAAGSGSIEQTKSNTIPIVISGQTKKTVEDNKCTVCGRTFLKSLQLKEHMKSHTGSERFECKYCKKSYKSKEKCLKHEAIHQRDVRLVYCELCDADFEFKANYLHHVQKVHGETKIEPQVGTKKAVPLTGGSIDRSFESEESDTDKLLSCQICETEVEYDKLVTHLKTHTIFQCDKCDEVFVQKTEYVAHLMSKHRNELDNATEKTPMKQTVNKVNSEKHSPDASGTEKVKTSPGGSEVGKKDKITEKDIQKMKKKIEKKLMKEKESNLAAERKEDTPKEKKKRSERKSMKGIIYDNEESDPKATKTTGSSDLAAKKKEIKLKFSCSKCELSFSSKGELIDHAETHGRDPGRFYCEICNTSYHKMKEKGYYIYHMLYHKDADLVATDMPENLICNLCKQPFTKDTLITHIKRDHALYSCDICEWSYSTESVLVSHMKRIHPREHKNFVFVKKDYSNTVLEYKPEGEKQSNVASVTENNGTEALKTISCKFCDKKFAKKNHLINHMKCHTVPEDTKILCELCNTMFNSRGTYLFHIEHHSKVEAADENENINENHSKAEQSDVFEDEKSDVKSEVKEHGDVKNETSQEKETVLNPVTGEFEEVTVQEVTDNQGNKNEVKDKKESGNLSGHQVYCRICSKSLTKAELLEHVRSHPLYSCELCEYAFLKKQKLIDHRQNIHLEEFITDEIKLFEIIEGTNSGDVHKPDKEISTGEKDVAKRKRGARLLNCSLCNLELKQDKYVDHLKGHIKPVMYCQFCERQFTKPNLHKMHEKSHERISHLDLPFPKLCPVCDTKIESREAYVVHLRTHKRKGPFECKDCNKVFTSDKILENHSKVYHESSVKVYWKGDGEGMKFDLRNGRISEVVSDHLAEIREMNELLKQNGRPEILHGFTPRKIKDRSLSINKSLSGKNEKGSENISNAEESEEITEEEKLKTDTSDEEYVPDESETNSGERRSERLAVKADKYESGEESEASKGHSKKRQKRTTAQSDSTESSDDTRKKKSSVKKAKLLALKKGRTGRYKVMKKGNKLLVKKNIKGKVLRSAFNKKEEKVSGRLKRKPDDKEPVMVKRLRGAEHSKSELKGKVTSGEKDADDFPEKCPDCGTFQFSKSSYEDHRRIHTGENPFKCPVCELSFTRDRNLKLHLDSKHKGYTPKNLRKRKKEAVETPTAGKLRTRTRNLEKDDMKPVSSSTPKRSPKLVVRLSPIDVSGDHSHLSKKSPEKHRKSLPDSEIHLNKAGKMQCQLCKRTFTTRWNYTQHVQSSHNEEEEDVKVQSGKKDLKKKEKESKPFSCKDCSESFKKKRDLYIHTKIHQADMNTDDNPTNISGVDQESNQSKSRQENSQNADKTEITVSFTSDDSKSASDVTVGLDKNTSEARESKKRGRKRKAAVAESDKTSSQSKGAKKSDVHSIDGSVSGIESDNSKLDKSDVEASTSYINSTIDKPSKQSQEDKGCDEKSTHSESQFSNIDEHSRTDSSDVDEKKIIKSQLPLTKLSAEKALQKWRDKVQATMASQLELNAAKKQEMLDNPEIARVKEKLSTKTKSEVRNFECRICGDKCNAETVFRKHMEEHLYESPPYCSICDIYFMAIYPKKRLADHNRKKHPIV